MQRYRPPLDAEEIARRREAFRQAEACDRIEGIPHDPATDPIFEALILGEIDVEEAIARIKAFCRAAHNSRISHKRFLPENVECFERSGPKRRPSKTGGF